MAVFIDKEQLASLERRMRERGYLDAQDMSASFNMLRANDLIWSFVVNNYLLGKEQLPFDLLFWNSDSVNSLEGYLNLEDDMLKARWNSGGPSSVAAP